MLTIVLRRVFILSNKIWDIASHRQANLKCVIGAFISVIFFQPFPQSMCGYANDGIYLWIEIGRAPKSVNSNAIFLNIVCFTFEIFFADVSKQPYKIVRPSQNSRGQNGIQFGSFRF